MTPSSHSVRKGDSFRRLSGKLPLNLAQQFLQPNFFHSPPFIPGPPTSPRFLGSQGPRASYQLTISRFSDMEFENGNDAFLTEEQVEALTTDDMEYVPWIDEEGEVDM